MKSIILATCLTLISCFTFAQTENPSVVGKWKIVLMDAGVSHDYKTNKTTYPEKFLKEMKGNKDSVFIVGLMGVMIENYSNYYFVFAADGKYQEIRETKVKQEGTYKIDWNNHEIETNCINKFGKPIIQKYLFKLKEGRLCFSIPQRDKKISIESEKVE